MKRLRILVVDDSFITQQIVTALLASLGHEIVALAETGAAALAAYQQFKPDLVTMDVVMPDMDGIEATRRMIAEDPAARILMVTSSSRQAQLDLALAAGASGCVAQPLTAEALAGAIGKLLLA